MRSYLTTLGSLAAAGVMLATFSSCGSNTPTASGSSGGAADPDLAAVKARLASTPLGRVVSRDARGAGRFVLASPAANAARLNVGHETVARLHFERHAAALGLNGAAVNGAVFKGWHALPAGAGLVQFEQRIGDVEVFRARASVVMDSAHQLVSISNSFPAANIKAWNKPTSFKLSAEEALASAYTAHAGVPLGASAVRDEGEITGTSARNYAVASPAGALDVLTATAKRVFFPTGDRLEPAYYVEMLGRAPGSRDNDARGYVIAADDGRVLQHESLTMNDVFNYRVWADPTGSHVPTDGPIADVTPHPTGLPDLKAQEFIQPIMVAMEGFNKNPSGAADPWLLPSDTVTWGNNVRAYSDRNQGTTEAGAPTNDGYQDAGPDGGGGDYRAEITAPNTFDRTYDLTKSPSETPEQIKAAITQLFYVNNWLHDYWYDSGFDEVSKNAQLSNFGRGGTQGDPLRAEAQDSADIGQSNNANMSPMSEGTSPRMQMYVWTGIANRKLDVTGATFADPLGAASFGPQTFDLSGQAVLSDDASAVIVTAGSTGSINDSCQKPLNVMGKIAVADRGGCPFTLKVDMAQQGGATGMILINNVTGNLAPSPPGPFETATIPLISISKEDGDKLKLILAGMPMARLRRDVETMRDGTIDNTVVAHEWGHFWHHRLVQCGSASCGGMSEGWGDFQALMMVIRDGDRFDNGKTYALAQYAAQGIAKDGSYFGIRRAPYSKDLLKNPFTFKHVSQKEMLPTNGAPLAPTGADLSEAHNVGEIWAQTLFEAYTNLIETLRAATPPVPFEEIKRRMADYLVAGMKATPSEPTFVEQRDAILSTIYATKRMDDFTAIAKGFAARGLGVAAVAPPTSSVNLNEAVENMDFKGALGFVAAKIDDSVTSCDRDGILDGGETGKLTVTIKNTGWAKLTKTQIKGGSTNPDVTFTSPTDMVTIEPFETKEVVINITAKAGTTMKTSVPVVITMIDSDAAKDSVDAKYEAVIHFDESKAVSKTDDAESTLPPVWIMENAANTATKAWSREGDAMNHYWHGDALASPGDETMKSPSLNVSATEPFTISFKHRFAFEVANVPGVGMAYVDGGLLEVSEDDGATWNDVSMYANPMYPQTIYKAGDGSDTNPLAGVKAWAGQSTGYPTNIPVTLDLGTKLAGKTAKVRFRIGTDEGTSTAGWDIDDIAFTGITNSPFAKVVDNAGMCGDGGTPTDGGAKDGSAGADAATGSGGAGGSMPPADDGCKCSVPGGRSAGGAGAAVGALGAIAMLLRRRRRQQS
ncbi:MAG TPA: M36 family metallopeptidase [Polyangiaceae bacterium]|nr:M36 family metallopeptidase [Polyangiaceae bacterium]